MHESDLQKNILQWFKSRSIYAVNIHGSGWTAKGVPDIIVCLNGQFIAFETKIDNNIMSPAQRIHMKRIKASGGNHFVPYTFDDFKKIMKEQFNYD